MSNTPNSLALRNASIIDGNGGPAFAGDVLIENGKIAAVGRVDGKAAEEIDVGGAVVAPGFIDVHTHYDAQALWDPLLTPSSLHGSTTVLAGNCGFTLAPLTGRSAESEYLLRMLSKVEGMPLEALQAGVVPSWTSFGSYLAHLDGKLAINAGFLVGHSALRVAVMGKRAVGEKATPEEIEAMKALLARSLQEGGLGFSTSISIAHRDMEGQPVPSCWASREELVALAEVTGRYPGTWLEVAPGSLTFTDRDYDAMTDMAVAAGRPLNWNVYIISSEKPESFLSQLKASDHARAQGADVFGLVQSGPSKSRINLRSGMLLELLPEWPEVLGLPHAEKMKALADPAVRQRLRDAPKGGEQTGPKWIFRDWSTLTIEEAFLPQNKHWEGHSLGEIGAALGKEPLDALLDLAIEEDLRTSFAQKPPGTDDATWQMRAKAWLDNDRCLLGGSDAGAHLDMIDAFSLPTRLLSEGVRQRKLISLEEAVRQLTDVPAKRFGLRNRGQLTPGMNADIVVFDPATIGVGPMEMRFDLPGNGMRLFANAIGVSKVIVNGVVVVDSGVPTGKRAGTIFRSGRDTDTLGKGSVH